MNYEEVTISSFGEAQWHSPVSAGGPVPMDNFHVTSLRYLAVMAAAFIIMVWILIDRMWFALWTRKHSYREGLLYDARHPQPLAQNHRRLHKKAA